MGGEHNQKMIPPNPPWKEGRKSNPVHDSLRPAILCGSYQYLMKEHKLGVETIVSHIYDFLE